MQLSDLHIHSRFSDDSDAEPAVICEKAISLGLREIAFTDHVDHNPVDDCYEYFDPVAYDTEINRCRETYGDRLIIRLGVEMSEPHLYWEMEHELLRSHEFDVVIGSLHWVGNRPDWDARYFEGLTLDEGLQAYFDELERMVSDDRSDFDILGHLDIVRRPVFYKFGITKIDYRPYEAVIRRTLRAVLDRGRIIEINTATYRRGMGEPCPPLQVLRWYVDEGGETVTLGSDAHTAGSVGAYLEHALDMARSVGICRLATYEKRQMTWTGLD